MRPSVPMDLMMQGPPTYALRPTTWSGAGAVEGNSDVTHALTLSRTHTFPPPHTHNTLGPEPLKHKPQAQFLSPESEFPGMLRTD